MKVAVLCIFDSNCSDDDNLHVEIESVDGYDFVFDVSMLNNKEMNLLKKAVCGDNDDAEIEMFFTGLDNFDFPKYGFEYDFELRDNKLIGKYIGD